MKDIWSTRHWFLAVTILLLFPSLGHAKTEQVALGIPVYVENTLLPSTPFAVLVESRSIGQLIDPKAPPEEPESAFGIFWRIFDAVRRDSFGDFKALSDPYLEETVVKSQFDFYRQIFGGLENFQ